VTLKGNQAEASALFSEGFFIGAFRDFSRVKPCASNIRRETAYGEFVPDCRPKNFSETAKQEI